MTSANIKYEKPKAHLPRLNENLYEHVVEYDDAINQDVENFHKRGEKSKKALRAAGAVLAVVGAASIYKMEQKPSTPILNGPHKQYIVKPHDTAWSISERAFPGEDPRDHTDMIAKETGDVLSVGETVTLPDSAKIGTEVQPSQK